MNFPWRAYSAMPEGSTSGRLTAGPGGQVVGIDIPTARGCYKIQRLESIQERRDGGLTTAEHEATQLAIR